MITYIEGNAVTIQNKDYIKLSFDNSFASFHDNDWFVLEKYRIDSSDWEKAEHVYFTQIATKYFSTSTPIMGVDYFDSYDLGYLPEYIDININVKNGASVIYDDNISSEYIYVYRIMYSIYTSGVTDSYNGYATNYTISKLGKPIDNYMSNIDDINLATIRDNYHLQRLNHRFRGGVESGKYNRLFDEIYFHLYVLAQETLNHIEEVDQKMEIVYNVVKEFE